MRLLWASLVLPAPIVLAGTPDWDLFHVEVIVMHVLSHPLEMLIAIV